MCPAIAGMPKGADCDDSEQCPKGWNLRPGISRFWYMKKNIYQPVLVGFQIGANIKIIGDFLKRTPIRHLRMGNKTQLLAVCSG